MEVPMFTMVWASPTDLPQALAALADNDVCVVAILPSRFKPIQRREEVLWTVAEYAILLRQGIATPNPSG